MITKEFVEACIEKAENGLPAYIPPVSGFSSDKVRRLLNNLCSKAGTFYLEIGVHNGSTFIPALYRRSRVVATCIDNWSPHPVITENKRSTFEDNIEKYLGKDRKINIIEHDMFTVDLALIPHKINVYFFDGPHDFPAQYQAFVHYNPIFADRFIAIVDDYNWLEPRDGTQKAFKDLGYQIVFERVLPGDYNGSDKNWWNGLYVAIVDKKGK